MSVAQGLSEPPTVEFVGVTTVLGKEIVLDEVSLSLPQGRTTVVMGPSGVGKSTLIRHVVGLLEPDEGAVIVDGRSVWGLAADELAEVRRGMGVLLGGSSVFDGSLFASMTVRENIAYPLRALGLPDDTVAARTRQVLEEFDLVGVGGLLPSSLSAGTRRRLALAKALVGDPALVVLDDPAPAMDLINRKRILGSIRRAQERRGATMLIITHDVQVARELGHHLAVLVNGRIVAEGDPEELLDGVDDGAAFDERFGFSGQQVTIEPGRAVMLAAKARIEYWLYDRGPLLVMVLVAVVLIVTWYLGFLDNGAASGWW